MWKTWMMRGALGVAVVLVVMQVVPYGRDHTNPTITAEPAWPPGSRALAQRACFDCHSNETVWPWYSNLAPVSWLIMRDTLEGRKQLNFSQWDRPQREADEAAKEVRDGEMPMALYLPLHHEARLTTTERAQLVAALEVIGKTAVSAGPGERSER